MTETVGIDGLEGWRHLSLGDVDSTNTIALEKGRAGDPGQLWVTGERQLAGRGRRGRVWVSEAGNLYASLLLVDPVPEERTGLLPLVTALALHDALAPLLAPSVEAKLKWPNDVLLNGAKCSGILLEAAHRDDGARLLVIGCGVNCTHHPGEGLYKTTSLAELGIGIAPQALFPHFATKMANRLAIWARPDGARHISRDFMAHAAGVQEPITVRYCDGEERGIFAGLDEQGYLLLQQESQTRRILAGDVFLNTQPRTS